MLCWQDLAEREAQLMRWEGELRSKEADLSSRSREMAELRARLAEEKGTVESVRREMANIEARAGREVRGRQLQHQPLQLAHQSLASFSVGHMQRGAIDQHLPTAEK